MKEKERYKVSVGSDYITICGYEENRIKALDNCGMQSLLNLQDNQIKAKGKEANTYAKEIVFLDNKIKLLERENQQLKKQLHDLPKKIVEEVEKNFTEYLPLKYKTGVGFYSRLNAILKKYEGVEK